MTSITWAGPRCVQEAATFLGPQNRTQGRCEYKGYYIKQSTVLQPKMEMIVNKNLHRHAVSYHVFSNQTNRWQLLKI